MREMSIQSQRSPRSGWMAAPAATCRSWISTSGCWTLAEQADLVYSPLVDRKDFPELVDITLVEGAVSNEDDLAKIKKVRAHTNVLVSLGDCAVTIATFPACGIRLA